MGHGNKSIADWQTEAYEIAKSKGWHDDPQRTFGDTIALIHSELSEALEAYRKSPQDFFTTFHCSSGYVGPDKTCATDGDPHKPEGIPIEFADVLIRIFDTCEEYGINLERAVREKMDYNRTRPHRHGGKAL